MASKHLDFVERGSKPKTKVWAVLSKTDGFELGKVLWYPSWRQYCFVPTMEGETVWSQDCLDDLGLFIWQVKQEHRNKE